MKLLPNLADRRYIYILIIICQAVAGVAVMTMETHGGVMSTLMLINGFVDGAT